MGVINVTPDSFSDDGLYKDVNASICRSLRFQEWGADIIDLGGESTRPAAMYPGTAPVSVDEELSRVIPVIEALKPKINIPICVDTYKAKVALEAIKAGASMVNDVWGFKRDSGMSRVVAEAGVPVVLMHNQDHTSYKNLIPDVIGELGRMRDNARRSGVALQNIILDPGIGFGKTVQHNLEILRHLEKFRRLGRPIMVGMSRKSTIGYVLGLSANDRIEGTAATVALSVAKGVDIVRVHDVKEMVRVARMSDAVVRDWTKLHG